MPSEGMTIITATGGRPISLALCKNYVMRQTYTGPLQWIVVDDCLPHTALPDVLGRADTTLTVIYPEPCWSPGQITLGRNLKAAIPSILYPRIVFMEDDDWYSPDYLDFMANEFDGIGGRGIVGEGCARYYHVPSRRYMVLNNMAHASMCQTGMTIELIPFLSLICSERNKSFLDIQLWQDARMNRFNTKIRNSSDHCIGIKGLYGRAGIGRGHCPNRGTWIEDNDWDVLTSWIGRDDVEAYRAMREHHDSQH